MIFAVPWALTALAALPLLWWLLRVTPPAPRSENFPAIRLLLGLHATEETPARTPWWLLLLRLATAALVILALARPVLDAGASLTGRGPTLLVVDNGWASAPEWPRRMEAASSVLDRAGRAGRQVALLTTAPDAAGGTPKLLAPMPIPDLRARLAALHPMPWPPDRGAAINALAGWNHPGTSVIYVADGLAHGASFAAFADALAMIGPVTEICCGSIPARALLSPESEAERLVARVAQVPQATATEVNVLAQSGDGRTLARAVVPLPAGAAVATAGIPLPPELRNRLSRLVLEGPPSAGSIALLDERWRRRPVGLLAGDQTTVDSPFSGPLYYLRRALAPFTELRSADTETLLRRDVSVLILADRPLPVGIERDALIAWVEKGGLLIRFAGPRIAETPMSEGDMLMPLKLLGGDRQLGGALSWSEPAGLAPFPASSPFAGLPVPDEVKVTRQVLAEPSADLASHSWALLADGTPLVTQAVRGAGRVVLFHVTANADWSNLPLSGLFVDMLRRLVTLSAGVASVDDKTVLAPAEVMDGFGLLTSPGSAATGVAADAIAATAVSPRHPPGLYGPENGRRALNLGGTLTALEAAPMVPGARIEPLSNTQPEREIGPFLLAAAIVLLALDMVIALGLRGLLVARVAASVVLLVALAVAGDARAQPLPYQAQAGQAQAGQAQAGQFQAGHPALSTRLAFILSGDAQVDGVARAGLQGLSEYVNRRTAASLAPPDGVEPGRSDLSPYPLLYWPIIADMAVLTAEQAAALNRYMSNGGIILIDTRDAGSGAGFAPGTASSLRRVAEGLTIPPLAPLTTEHVLSRAFYLLSDFPGRFTGDSVWAQRDQDRANDSVSPVIIGGNDWGAAWAIDAAGRNPYAVIPGGQRQRVLAYRFGVNLVMYALTGNYKGDQVHVPAILQRLGQ